MKSLCCDEQPTIATFFASQRGHIAKALIAMVVLLCLWTSADAAIVLDSTTNATEITNTLTWSHTVGTGTNRILIV